MENVKNNVNKLTKTSNYRFKADIVKNILKDFKLEFKKNIFNKAFEIDKKKHPVYIEYEKLVQIIDSKIQSNDFIVKFTPENIIDGYGNIAVDYNGNPYVTMNLALAALKTHNNIIFFSKKYYAINSIIIQTLNKVCQKNKYGEIGLVEFGSNDDIVQNHQLFDLMLYIGDKREYQKIKRKVNLPVIFYGYGYVDVYVESREFKDLLLDIDEFANKNDIIINYFDNTSFDETLEFVNKYEISDSFVLISKNTDMIYKFMSQIRTNKFYINQNPFENYEFKFDENKLVYDKKIFLKKL